MMPSFLQRHSKVISYFFFWVYIIVLLLTTNTQETLFYRPQSVHVWRQSDCAAQSLNYHQNDLSFWMPQVHNHYGKNGFAASEFPVLYYLIGQLYDVFGYHEFIHRGVTLLVSLLGLWFFFLLCQKLIGNSWVAFFPVIILSTTPFFFYYANNFLPNVPAIAFALIGWYAIFKFVEVKKKWWLLLFGVTMLLSILLKVSEGVSFVAILCLLGGQYTFPRFFGKPIIGPKHLGFFSFVSILVIGLSVAWYLYARWFNGYYGNTGSLLGILPIWIMNEENWKEFNYMVFEIWWAHYHHPDVMNSFWIGAILMVVFWKHLNQNLKWITMILLVGVICYTILWFRAFGMHDYYILTLVIYPAFLYLTLAEAGYRKWHAHKWLRWLYILPLLLFSYMGFINNMKIQDKRYKEAQYGYPAVKPFYTITPYLRSIGVEREDLVVSLPDFTPNVSLYLMNNQGYTEAFFGKDYPIEKFIEKGVKYLILNDSSYLAKENLRPYIQQQIGHYQGVLIFDLTNID